MDVCANVSKLSSDIKKMLKEQSNTRLNQTAALDGNKITEIKTSVGAYHRTPKGKAVIYTGDPAYPVVEANSRDVREIVEHERPFMCRAVMVMGRPYASCYSAEGDLYDFVKEDIERANELIDSFKAEMTKLWGEYPKKLSFAERAFVREQRRRENELDDILDGLAPKVLKTCKIAL